MDPLPPNDPNRNNNINAAVKETPYEGRRPQRNRQRQGQNGEIMDAVGDLRDSPVVVIMFLVGVASWLLRERMICGC